MMLSKPGMAYSPIPGELNSTYGETDMGLAPHIAQHIAMEKLARKEKVKAKPKSKKQARNFRW